MTTADKIEEKTIKSALSDLKNRLSGLLGDKLELFVLFGSRARGDYDLDSDIDIAVVVRGLNRELRKNIYEKTASVELEYLVPISCILLSAEEYRKLLKRERRLALDIKKEGIPL